MKGWIWIETLSDCNPCESHLAMDLIPGHWPVSDTDRRRQLIPGESPPLPLWSSPTTSESFLVQGQKHQSPPNPCLPTSTPHDVFITACSGHTHNTAVVCYTAANNYLQSNTPWPTLLSVIHRQTKVSVVKCGNHKFMDCCCIHCCTMLLCFSRPDVTLVTTGHSLMSLSAPILAASQLWLTAHSAMSPASSLLYSCTHCCTSVHSKGRTLTFAAPDPGPSPDHPPSSLSPLSSSERRIPRLVTLYEQGPRIVTQCSIIDSILVTHNTKQGRYEKSLTPTMLHNHSTLENEVELPRSNISYIYNVQYKIK